MRSHRRWSPIPELAVTLLALAACGGPPGQSAGGAVTSATIGPAGGSLVLSASDDQRLAGTSITIPPGALTKDVIITISASSETVTPAGWEAAGPVVDFGPDGTAFAVPVIVQIPITLAGAAKASLAIRAVEADGTARSLPVEALVSGLATFQVDGFTRFGGIAQAGDGGSECSTDADCPTDEACVNGACEAASSSDGGNSCGPAPSRCACECADPSTCPSPQCLACSSTYCYCSGSQWIFVSAICGADGGSGGCRTDADCGGCPNLCVNGQCRITTRGCVTDGGEGGFDTGPVPFLCQSSSDCPPSQYCQDGVCVDGPRSDAGASCATDADCGGCPYVCSNGQCEATTMPCPADGGTGGLQWYTTCGYPVCMASTDGGTDAGTPVACPPVGSPCMTPGQTCGTRDAQNCGVIEQCASQDPKLPGCPR